MPLAWYFGRAFAPRCAGPDGRHIVFVLRAQCHRCGALEGSSLGKDLTFPRNLLARFRGRKPSEPWRGLSNFRCDMGARACLLRRPRSLFSQRLRFLQEETGRSRTRVGWWRGPRLSFLGNAHPHSTKHQYKVSSTSEAKEGPANPVCVGGGFLRS